MFFSDFRFYPEPRPMCLRKNGSRPFWLPNLDACLVPNVDLDSGAAPEKRVWKSFPEEVLL